MIGRAHQMRMGMGMLELCPGLSAVIFYDQHAFEASIVFQVP